MKPILFALLAVTTAAGCSVNPRSYESEPVALATTQGEVTCQLYRPDLVVWDRSIDRPESMSLKMADDICYAAGWRQKRGEQVVPNGVLDAG